MSLIRLQKNVPYIYPNESRDFQLFLHLYDCVVNGIEFDINTIPTILDSSLCRTNILPLLQTKIGFFTHKNFDDSSLRFILECFPIIVKKKGTLTAVIEALNMFLKIKNINTNVSVYYTSESSTLYNKYTIPDHTVVISIDSSIQDVSILNEVFKYIMPIGIGYYFYFYASVNQVELLKLQSTAKLLYVSNNYNSMLADEQDMQTNNDLVHAVDTITFVDVDNISNNNYEISALKQKVGSTQMNYLPGNEWLFIGIIEDTVPFNQHQFPAGMLLQEGMCLIYRYNNEDIFYYYTNTITGSYDWIKMEFKGIVNMTSVPSTGYSTGDVLYNLYNNNYIINNGSSFTVLQDGLALYKFKELIVNDNINEI